MPSAESPDRVWSGNNSRAPLRLRHTRQAGFDMPDARFRALTLGGRPWRVYDNANLSIHVTDKCNADCPFCIAHLRYLNEGRTYLKPELADDEAYFNRMDGVLRLVTPLKPSVSITGGEPTVNRKLPTILRVLAAHGVRKRTMTTNGTGLHWRVAGSSDTVLDRLGEYRLEHLNISRAHFDQASNNRLMKMAGQLLPEAQLRESIQEACNRGIRVRLSCVLLNDGIRTVDDMTHYLEWARRLGVDNVIFRQLMDFDTRAVKPGLIPTYCAQNQVELVPLWEELDLDSRFQFYHHVLGYYYYVEVRKYQQMDVVTEMADLRLIEPFMKKFSERFAQPTAFEMVYHPNGNLCAGWHEQENVMSEMPDA